jgi:hypothetical protein
VKNQGAWPVSAGTPIRVSFRVGGKEVSWADTTTTQVLPGSMILVCANRGPASASIWNADSAGTFTVTAVTDPTNAIEECVEANNSSTVSVEVIPKPRQNLALRKPVTVSSSEGYGLEGTKAVDGNAGSRWSSLFNDPQAITIDLGARYLIDRVILRWETAYGKEYTIQLSDNNALWAIAAYEQNGNGGNDTITLSKPARYVKMFGLKRGTEWGYSLYEFEVYGSVVTGIEEAADASIPKNCALFENYPNPFNPATTIEYTIGGVAALSGSEGPASVNVRLTVYDMLGREVGVLVNIKQAPGRYQLTFDARGLASGTYFYRLVAGEFVQTRRMLLIR